jgi:hypothetical protein
MTAEQRDKSALVRQKRRDDQLSERAVTQKAASAKQKAVKNAAVLAGNKVSSFDVSFLSVQSFPRHF